MTKSQNARAEGSGNIIVQAIGDGIMMTIGLPHLTLTPARPPKVTEPREIDILNARSRAIPLIGRDSDLRDLEQWLSSDAPISIRVLTGGAGAGKTRLAIELMEGLKQNEIWQAGFATDRELRRFADQQNLSDWGCQKSTLIVVDYASASTQSLRTWIEELAASDQATEDVQLRLLLLEREASTQIGWLQNLQSPASSYSSAGVRELFDPWEPIPVTQITTAETSIDRRAIIKATLEKAKSLPGNSVELPPPGTNPAIDARLAEPIWADPLYLMLAALDSRHTGVVHALSLTLTALAREMAQREIERLKRYLPAVDRALEPLFLRGAVCATLEGGFTQAQCITVFAEEGHILGLQHANGPGALASLLTTAYPGGDGGVAPIRPGIIGEAFLLESLTKNSLQEQRDLIGRAATRDREAVVASVIRITLDYSQQIPDQAANSPLTWLDNLIDKGTAGDFEMLQSIDNAMPQQTLVLRERAATNSARMLAFFQDLPDAAKSETMTATVARHTDNLAVRLGALGQREQALNAAHEAADLYRDLATVRPDAFTPELAASLNNLANCLSALGRREEALKAAKEATDLYRELTLLRPDAFLPDLAMSLNNLANSLSDLGRREEALMMAQESVDIRRDLAALRPDAFTPDLAMPLNTLASRLGDLGLREEALKAAQEAADLSRNLAAIRPDAFTPELALSLNNLANRLSDLGLREEALKTAQEATDLYRDLAAIRPDAFTPDLAGSINNLGVLLSALGRREEALKASQEAVEIRRDLAALQPDAFTSNLAVSLNNLANSLSNLGRREEALKAGQEAADLYRGLAALRPDAFTPGLAMSLNNLANNLSDLGLRDEALDTAQQSVDIRRDLAALRPDVFTPDLAVSLSNLAGRLSDFGLREGALKAAQEAVDLQRDLATIRPETFTPDLAMSLNNLGALLSDLGWYEEALKAAQESVDIRRSLAALRPDAFASDLAMSLNNLANRHSECGEHEEALKAAQESVDIRRVLAAVRPDSFAPDLAMSLNNLANSLSDLGLREDALEATEEAVNIRRELFALRPGTFTPDLATSLGTQGAILMASGRYGEAVQAFAEGLGIIAARLVKYPLAFARLAGALAQDYLQAVQAAEGEPDVELLAPIIEILNTLQKQGEDRS